MARRNRLAPIIEIAETRQQEAARQLAHLMQHQTALQNQIAQLKGYREDYKKTKLLEKKLPPSTLMDRRVFLARLNENIEQLLKQLAAIDDNLASRMKYWHQTRARTQALEKVVERYQAREQSRQARQLQKEHDELASRKGGFS